jgi:hypothetical protein
MVVGVGRKTKEDLDANLKLLRGSLARIKLEEQNIEVT